MGYDYHWYRKRHFRLMVETFYKDPQSQCIDRTWLSCLSIVLALGESYNDNISPSFFVDERLQSTMQHATRSGSQNDAPPGIELFEQGLLLFKPCYEQPTIEQIEALNLIVRNTCRICFSDHTKTHKTNSSSHSIATP